MSTASLLGRLRSFGLALACVALSGCAFETGADDDAAEEVESLESDLAERAGCARKYADDFRGWPVAPIHEQHPIRGAFQEPRTAGYHNGIDISVRDDRPEAGAPEGTTHKVFALEGGEVTDVRSS